MKYLFLLLVIAFPLKAMSQLSMPIGGEQNKDWWIWTYMDNDTTTGSVSNFKCSSYCYDNWHGLVFILKNLQVMDKGIPVLAAAGGTVTNKLDTFPDRAKESGSGYGNIIRIEHNPQLYTFYAYLKHGSARVKDGQVVKKGDTIGYVGSSGGAFDSKLYFRVEGAYNSHFLDPLGNQCASPPYSAYLSTIPIYDTTYGLLDAGVTNSSAVTVDTIIERPPTITEISVTDDPFVCVWTQAKNAYTGDMNDHIWIKPDGSIFKHHQWTETSDSHLGYPRSWEPTFKLDTGIWMVKCFHNGDSITTQTFHVVLQHSGVAQTTPLPQIITFPQPAKDHITISGLKAKELHLYDIEGVEHPIRFEQNGDDITAFWQELPKGLYWLSIKNYKGNFQRAKIIIAP